MSVNHCCHLSFLYVGMQGHVLFESDRFQQDSMKNAAPDLVGGWGDVGSMFTKEQSSRVPFMSPFISVIHYTSLD